MATAFVTGCSSGFGRLTALELARRGHHVVATMRDTDRADALLDEAGDLDVTVLHCDVNDPASVDGAVAAAEVDHGGIGVLVNNAGVELRGAIEACSDDEARWQFETNVFGLLRVVRATAPRMRERGEGVIVNVGSIAGLISRPFAGLYAASKHAVEAISEALHFELGLFGIRVHVVEPGQFDTSLRANTKHAARAGEVEAYRQAAEAFDRKIRSVVPGGAPADPQDVADRIADVVDDPSAPLRVPVGGDTELILGARHGHTFEEYEATMRSFLDFWDGHRDRS